jgi:tRNA 2-thiocytidine biosynthesis protein TtcA
MGYASELETKIAKKVTKAIVEHKLIEDGDRVMVGLSGGKDSWALIQILDVLQKRAPIRFSLVAVNIDSGYDGYEHHKLTETCAARGWELHVEHTTIGETIEEILDASATPCSLCARLRRGALYRLADTVGASKIALGHHADDFIETLLLNIFFQGSIKAMPARLVSDNGKHVVIRPLAYVLEAEAREYAKTSALPIIGCCCPACGDLSLQRQRMKRLVAQLEVEHPDVKSSIMRALGNVQPRHLLAPEKGTAKPRLSDVVYLAESDASERSEAGPSNGACASERRDASHANGARRRSGARESVSGSPRGEAPRIKTEVR